MIDCMDDWTMYCWRDAVHKWWPAAHDTNGPCGTNMKCYHHNNRLNRVQFPFSIPA